MKTGRLVLMMVMPLALAITSACGNGNGKNESASTPAATAAEPTKAAAAPPVKIVAYSWWQDFTDAYWKQILIDPVKKKYPNIDVQIVKPEKNGAGKLQEMIAGGETPDIVLASVLVVKQMADMGYNYDMTPMIKKHNMDLSPYDSSTMNYLKATSPNGGISVLPYATNFLALYYNKDIFDKFGVPYPKDGMTFSQIVELTKKLSRSDSGKNYIGFDYNSIGFLAGGITNDYFDPSTGKANLSTKEWRLAYDLLSQLIAIPGNRFPGDVVQWHLDDFIKTQNVAMIGTPNMVSSNLATAQNLNWDMASYPHFDGYPAVSQAGGGQGLYLNPKSAHLDEAFEVVQTALSSESQVNISRNGAMPFLVTNETKDAFAADLPYAKGKNVKAAFYNKPGLPQHPTTYDATATTIAYNHTMDLFKGKDVNTVIRETEEEIDKTVQKQKDGQK